MKLSIIWRLSDREEKNLITGNSLQKQLEDYTGDIQLLIYKGNGQTFEENALIKARAISKESGCLVLADDSGLEVDYMDKAPGIYSARFLGEDTSYRIKNQYIIDKLAGVPDPERTARFVCAIAAVFPDGSEYTERGTIEGIIGYEERGENGFGYDPIFYLPELGKTTAELDPEEKNKISHRGNALRLMKNVIRAHRESK